VRPCRRLPDDPAKAWAIVEERGYEGMVAKARESTYRSEPTGAWVKVKVRHEGVFVVGGYRNVDAFDGVLVGEYVGDRLETAWLSGATGRRRCSPSCAARRITLVGGRLRAPSWRCVVTR
jgi:ATP-dependent DNA ligase